MKKFLSGILALAMILSLSVGAMATEASWTGNETIDEIGVNATVSTAGTVAPAAVYSVKIQWTTPAITYTANAATYQWDPVELKYVETAGVGGAWSENNTTTVTVTNRSDAAINAAVSYVDKVDDNANSSATWKIGEEDYTAGSNKEIGSAAVSAGEEIEYTDTEASGTAQSCEFVGTINVTGSLAATGQIGTITVTLSKTAA